VVEPAAQGHAPGPGGVVAIRFIRGVQIEAVRRGLARSQCADDGHKGGENNFHCPWMGANSPARVNERRSRRPSNLRFNVRAACHAPP